MTTSRSTHRAALALRLALPIALPLALPLAAAVLALVALATPAAASATTESEAGTRGLPWEPCEYEDSNDCVWDARHMGNGYGQSFKASPRGKITYLTHRRAHRLLHR